MGTIMEFAANTVAVTAGLVAVCRVVMRYKIVIRIKHRGNKR